MRTRKNTRHFRALTLLLTMGAGTALAHAQGPSLVVHYELDETSGTLVSDSSGNGLDAQTMGGASWAPGLIGGGLDLDEGLNGHAASPHDPLHNVAQLTIAAWVNVDELGNYDGVLTKGSTVSPYSLMLSNPDGTFDPKFKFQINNFFPPNGTGGGIYTSSGNLATNQWHHIAVTFDEQDVRLYLDGVLDSVHNASGVIIGTTTEDLIMGVDLPGGDEYFDGTLDDVRLYDGPLSASEIADLHGGSRAVLYCFGDGTATACPCGNTSTTGGCANGTGDGATLSGTGMASIMSDTLVLQGTGLIASQPGLYFQGNNAVNGGNGTNFGDGLRCAGGGVIRLQVRFAGGAGASSTNISISAKGMPAAGDVKRYQLWYRDPNTTPCGAQFNLSNGLEVTWGA